MSLAVWGEIRCVWLRGGCFGAGFRLYLGVRCFMLKKFVLGSMVVVAALLGNACGDDGSGDFPAGPADSEGTLSSSSDDVVPGNSSSSSVTESPSTSSGQAPQSAESDGSSSSEKAVDGSSSSDGKASSSSGKVESSSSGKGEKSSSSEGAAGSSSSEVVAGPSSSEKSSSSVTESSSSVESSSSKEPSSSSVVESSSSVVESSSSSSEIDKKSSSSEFSSSSQQKTVLDSSYYNAEENTLTDFRDGQIYKTVSIGNQIWMAQDLKIKKYGNLTIKSYCYEDNSQNCDSIGRLYIRSAAFDSVGAFSSSGKGCGKNNTACSLKKPARGICPKNWHVADSLEWVNLFNEVEKNNLNLMATQGWDESCYENPTNGIYGFNALPGYRGSNGKYSKWASYFWVAEKNVRSFSLSCYWEPKLPIISSDTPESAFSVRCLKDSE